MQAIMTRVFRGLAWLVLVGLIVEVYLVGAELFGVATIQPHRLLGVILAVAILLLLVLALIARPGPGVVRLAAVLAALTVVQVVLPQLQHSLPVVAALHAVNALALLAVTAAIVRAPTAALDSREADTYRGVPSA